MVEIGVAEGMSAAILRRAMDRDGTLWLIDPFSPLRRLSPALLVARRTVRRAGGAQDVRWIRRSSTEVGPTWSSSIDFLFIDGDHAEEACERDWLAFSPSVVPGGRVAFHDAADPVHGCTDADWGPVRVCDRYFRNVATRDRRWTIVEEIDSLTVVERL